MGVDLDRFDGMFGRKILEGYIAVAILVLTVVAYLVLAGVGFGDQSNFVMLAILLVILISVNLLNAIILLRILDAVRELRR